MGQFVKNIGTKSKNMVIVFPTTFWVSIDQL